MIIMIEGRSLTASPLLNLREEAEEGR